MAPTRHSTAEPKRRVLLVSSPTLFGESLELLLRGTGDIELVGSVALHDDVCQAVARDTPDVVVLADEHPERAGVLNLTAVLMERFPDLRVIKTGPAEATLRVLAAQSWPASSLDLISAIREGPTRRT